MYCNIEINSQMINKDHGCLPANDPNISYSNFGFIKKSFCIPNFYHPQLFCQVCVILSLRLFSIFKRCVETSED